ncbi:MATE family efflux transporter [Flavivirga sp. 57AJ16]|uniref:MATE family efflux transporter n=1 Tax=Flavivirga sp. 57AJ16 TaxID=3025307 RepID=UPI0023653346|nr:MATE family efflux transporter [Flavivirga sp. 57AJ16]MDD7887574.1 MATE family efflux transporter [Flavivirga sp. 57AJ16]
MKSLLFRIGSLVDLCRLALSGKVNNNYTVGGINRSIFIIALPAVAELIIESVFVGANFFFVGRLSSNAIAIAGTTMSFTALLYAAAVGISIATSALISRRMGAKEYDIAGQTVVQTMYLTLPIALGLSMGCAFWTEEILKLIGLSEPMIREGRVFASLMFISSGLLIVRMVNNGIFRGAGNPAVAMRSQWISNGIHLLLCPILIFGWGMVPEMGLLGMALAAIASRTIGVGYQAWIFFNKNFSIQVSKEHFVFQPQIFKSLIRLSIGGTLQFLIPASSWVIMIKIMSFFGDAALTGYVLAQRIGSISTMPAWGIGNAAGVLTGHNLGAHKPERAETSVWRAGRINVLFLAIIALCWAFFSEPIFSFFSNDPQVIEYSKTYIHLISLAYLLLGYTMVISRSLNAAGNVWLVTLMYLIVFYCLQIPLSYYWGVELEFEYKGVFTALLVSEFLLGIICILVFKSGKWKKIKI